MYRATDTRLNREVAIKVLPDSFANHPDRLARFDREAQLLASLNHPNIAAIYGVEERALVLELVEGPTLAERIAQRAIPLDEALAIARQIAEAVEYAHDKGVIHRDLKPANIKINPEARVKVLDFGLAKALASEPASADPAASPTMTLRATLEGVILGTAAYMSPEQARGKTVDRRADIWAFGVVLYEMLAGRTLFGHGETVTDTLASVVREEPDWTALPSDTPVQVRRVLERCLQKDPRNRLRDIGDVRLLLDEKSDALPAPAIRKRQSRKPWILAAGCGVLSIVLAAALAVSSGWFHPKPADVGALRFVATLPEGASFDSMPAAPHSVPSPNGRIIAIAATEKSTNKRFLWTRTLGSFTAQRLDRTEGATLPFWSPDGQYVGFHADGKLRKIAIAGGTPQTLCEAPGPPASGTWNTQGTILFDSTMGNGNLMRVAAGGGVAPPATRLDQSAGERVHAWPQFLPDGKYFVYLALNSDATKSAIYIQELDSGKRFLVMRNATRAAFAPPGYLLFTREGTLFAQPLDMKSFQLQGEAVPVAEDVNDNVANGVSTFAVSENGVLSYRTVGSAANQQLAWYSRDGKRIASVGEPGGYSELSLSPDGKSAAVRRRGTKGMEGDIWVMNLDTGVNTRITFDARLSYRSPAWSPDSQRIAVVSQQGLSEVVVASLTNKALLKDANLRFAFTWSPDGRYLVTSSFTGIKTELFPLKPDEKPKTIFEGKFSRYNFQFSPDGKWLAYSSNESGQNEVYVAAFPSLSAQRKISSGGGMYPFWRKDGKELFFQTPDAVLQAVPVRLGETIEIGNPKPLFKMPVFAPGMQYGVANDGQKILVNERIDQQRPPEFSVIVNWAAELKR